MSFFLFLAGAAVGWLMGALFRESFCERPGKTLRELREELRRGLGEESLVARFELDPEGWLWVRYPADAEPGEGHGWLISPGSVFLSEESERPSSASSRQ